MATSPICSRAREVVESFRHLEIASRDVESQQFYSAAPDFGSIPDSLGRFKIWAGNIGALQRFELKSSLDWRIREAPKISTQIVNILEELIESLDDARSIISQERENRTSLNAEERQANLEGHEESDPGLAEGDEDDDTSEIHEIFMSIEDSINSLFRLSIIIRNNTNRDRYAKATAAAVSTPFDDFYDRNHVQEKFPLLMNDGKEWLSQRLGRAITLRRQYLRYCREHHAKTSKEHEQEVVPMRAPENPFYFEPVLAAPVHDVPTIGAMSDWSKPISTLAPTQASTLVLTTADILEEEELEDLQSQTSYATSHDEDTSSSKLHVVALEDVSKGAKHFECPYCWQIQAITAPKAWRKHVFTDLKPYVCLFEKCELKLFADRRQWLSHELKDHRREWICYFCSRKPFSSTAQYQQHLAKHHPKSYIANQLPALYDMSQHGAASISASACPFCKSWETRLREINPQIPLSDDLVVTPSQFFAHVGGHMEQLALFAIPRGDTESGNADSNSQGSGSKVAAPGVRSRTSSIHGSLPDSKTGEKLRLCEDILNDLLEAHEATFISGNITDDLLSSLREISDNLQTGKYSSTVHFRADIIALLETNSTHTNYHLLKSVLQDRASSDLDLDVDREDKNVKQFSTEASILESLDFPKRLSRAERISAPHPETFEWIYGDFEVQKGIKFSMWLEYESSGVYWIQGGPGSGKSTLMKFIATNPETLRLLQKHSLDNSHKFTLAAFYFCSRGTSEEHSETGLLRSLLYQILSQNEDLIPTLFPEFSHDKNLKIYFSQEWKLPRLRLLLSHINSLASRDLQLCLFIDAIDECDRNEESSMAQFFQVIKSPWIRVCCSSRFKHSDFSGFTFRYPSTFMLEELTIFDISQFASEKLRLDERMAHLFAQRPDEANLLAQSIVDRSDGCFRWVVLVVKKLLRGLGNHDTLADLQARIDGETSNTEALQTQISVEEITGTEHRKDLETVMDSASTAWSQDRVTAWLAENGFSDQWIKAFDELGISGAVFLALHEGHIPRTKLDDIYSHLADQRNWQGEAFDPVKEYAEGERMVLLIKNIVVRLMKNLFKEQKVSIDDTKSARETKESGVVNEELDRVFSHALNTVANIPIAEPQLATSLLLYGLIKQATEGDAADPEEWQQIEESENEKLRLAQERWGSWNDLKGMSRTGAKIRYIRALVEFIPQYASGFPAAMDLIKELKSILSEIDKDILAFPSPSSSLGDHRVDEITVRVDYNWSVETFSVPVNSPRKYLVARIDSIFESNSDDRESGHLLSGNTLANGSLHLKANNNGRMAVLDTNRAISELFKYWAEQCPEATLELLCHPAKSPIMMLTITAQAYSLSLSTLVPQNITYARLLTRFRKKISEYDRFSSEIARTAMLAYKETGQENVIIYSDADLRIAISKCRVYQSGIKSGITPYHTLQLYCMTTNEAETKIADFPAYESLFYSQVYDQARCGKEHVTFLSTVDCLKSAGLTSENVTKIWVFVNSINRIFLQELEFYILLRLVGHSLDGKAPSLELKKTPLARPMAAKLAEVLLSALDFEAYLFPTIDLEASELLRGEKKKTASEDYRNITIKLRGRDASELTLRADLNVNTRPNWVSSNFLALLTQDSRPIPQYEGAESLTFGAYTFYACGETYLKMSCERIWHVPVYSTVPFFVVNSLSFDIVIGYDTYQSQKVSPDAVSGMTAFPGIMNGRIEDDYYWSQDELMEISPEELVTNTHWDPDALMAKWRTLQTNAPDTSITVRCDVCFKECHTYYQCEACWRQARQSPTLEGSYDVCEECMKIHPECVVDATHGFKLILPNEVPELPEGGSLTAAKTDDPQRIKIKVYDLNNNEIERDALLDQGSENWIGKDFLGLLAGNDHPGRISEFQYVEYPKFDGRMTEALGKVTLRVSCKMFGTDDYMSLSFLVKEFAVFDILIGRKTLEEWQLGRVSADVTPGSAASTDVHDDENQSQSEEDTPSAAGSNIPASEAREGSAASSSKEQTRDDPSTVSQHKQGSARPTMAFVEDIEDFDEAEPNPQPKKGYTLSTLDLNDEYNLTDVNLPNLRDETDHSPSQSKGKGPALSPISRRKKSQDLRLQEDAEAGRVDDAEERGGPQTGSIPLIAGASEAIRHDLTPPRVPKAKERGLRRLLSRLGSSKNVAATKDTRSGGGPGAGSKRRAASPPA